MADERFKKVQDEYAVLKAQLDSGRITREQFEATLRPLMFQDAQGRYWMIGVETGKWHAYDGQKWVQTDPPAPEPPPPPPPPAPTILTPKAAAATVAPTTPRRLVVSRGVSNMQSVELGNDSITIGRATSNVLVLNDLQASRLHARIDFDNGNWSIRDLNSRNGTFVNGQRVTLQALRAGDQLTIGESLLAVQG